MQHYAGGPDTAKDTHACSLVLGQLGYVGYADEHDRFMWYCFLRAASKACPQTLASCGSYETHLKRNGTRERVAWQTVK